MNFVSLFEEYCAVYNLPVIYARWIAFSLLSAFTQRKLWYGEYTQPLYTNLFVLLVGDPGSGKTQVMRRGTELLELLNQEAEVASAGLRINYELTQATPAAVIAKMVKLKQTIPGFNGYATITQSPLFIYSEEAGTFLKDLGGGDTIQELLHLFDCPKFFKKETRSFGVEHIEFPYMSFTGATTPDYFDSFMNSTATGMGLSARFIYGVVKIEDEMRYNPNAKPDQKLLQAMLLIAKRITLTKGYIKEAADSADIIETLIDNYDAARKSAAPGSYLKHYYSRKFITVRKLACLLSLGENSSREVMRRHYELAHAYLTETESKVDGIFKAKSIKNQSAMSGIIESCIAPAPIWRTGKEVLREVHRSGWSYAGAEIEAMNCLRELVEVGKIRIDTTQEEQRFQRV